MDAFLIVQWVLRALLAVLFVGMGVLHFVPRVQRTMAAMIPERLRSDGFFNPKNLVILSGIAEIAGGLALVAPVDWIRFVGGIGLIALLVAVFPANAHAARHPDKFGATAVPVVPRLIGQIVLGALILVAII